MNQTIRQPAPNTSNTDVEMLQLVAPRIRTERQRCGITMVDFQKTFMDYDEKRMIDGMRHDQLALRVREKGFVDAYGTEFFSEQGLTYATAKLERKDRMMEIVDHSNADFYSFENPYTRP